MTKANYDHEMISKLETQGLSLTKIAKDHLCVDVSNLTRWLKRHCERKVIYELKKKPNLKNDTDLAGRNFTKSEP